MNLDIFDVEHGACALVTTSNGKRLLIDCGHNGRTSWSPGASLVASGIHTIDRLFVTNFDEDHASGYPDLYSKINIRVLVTNPTVRADTVMHLKTEDGMGVGIESLVLSMKNFFTGGPPDIEDFGDTSFSVYYNAYGTPPHGFDDENNLSLVVFQSCGGHKIVFPGDLEKAGWRNLIQNHLFANELRGVTLFVASHHGRDSGYCEEVMRLCPNIQAVIISDKKHGFQTQDTVGTYRKHARGFIYDGGERRVLTTRRDKSMSLSISADGTATIALGLTA
ncbi:MAG: hypothetical protein RIF42_16555 [Parvibaculaceae bacterium]